MLKYNFIGNNMQLNDNEMKLASLQYQKQRNFCKRRIDKLGNQIEMKLTFEEWLNIWLSSGHYHERGNKRGQYVMSRLNDIGHYEIGNIEIKTVRENIIEKCNSPENKETHRLAMKLAGQKKVNDPVYRENFRLGREKMKHNPEYWNNQQIGGQKRSQNPEWRENTRLAREKVLNKPISCDGVIYESIKSAALILAPETRLNDSSKIKWLNGQMKKYPDRYFRIAKSE